MKKNPTNEHERNLSYGSHLSVIIHISQSWSDTWIRVHKSAGQVLWPTSRTSAQNTSCPEGIRSAWSAFTLRSTWKWSAGFVRNVGPMDTSPPPRAACWWNNGNCFTSSSTLDVLLATAAHFAKAFTLWRALGVRGINCRPYRRSQLFSPRCVGRWAGCQTAVRVTATDCLHLAVKNQIWEDIVVVKNTKKKSNYEVAVQGLGHCPCRKWCTTQ